MPPDPIGGPGFPPDDVQRLANHLRRDIHINKTGSLSYNPQETVAENIRNEDADPRTGGNCGQDPERVPNP